MKVIEIEHELHGSYGFAQISDNLGHQCYPGSINF